MDEQNRIVSFLERPDEESRSGQTSRWVNSGICVCHPEVLDSIPAGVPADFPKDIFPRLLNTGRIFGFPLTGYRCAIDSEARLQNAVADLRNNPNLISAV